MHFLHVYNLLFVSGFWIEALVYFPFSVMHLMIFPLKHAFCFAGIVMMITKFNELLQILRSSKT